MLGRYVYLSEAEAADYLGVTLPELEAMRLNSSGPDYVQLPNRVRYRGYDLDVWLIVQEYLHGEKIRRSGVSWSGGSTSSSGVDTGEAQPSDI